MATVYHGIDIENFVLNESPGEYLLFYGRIHPDKGTKQAIEIAKKAKMRLIIAGIIQDREYYKAFIEPNLLGQDIDYIGSIGPDGRNKVLGNAVALLHPINFEEPFGLSVVESMACGTPAIAFKKGSMPEIIRSGTDGFLVDNVSEAVEAVHKLHNIDRKRCRQTVQECFTRDIMVNSYIKVYEKIIANQQTVI
jgi:glycosyltransferase involved in cell wall biosynthesis